MPITIGSLSGYNNLLEIGLGYVSLNGNNAILEISYQSETYILNYTNFDNSYLVDAKRAIYFISNGNLIVQLVYEETYGDINE